MKEKLVKYRKEKAKQADEQANVEKKETWKSGTCGRVKVKCHLLSRAIKIFQGNCTLYLWACLHIKMLLFNGFPQVKHFPSFLPFSYKCCCRFAKMSCLRSLHHAPLRSQGGTMPGILSTTSRVATWRRRWWGKPLRLRATPSRKRSVPGPGLLDPDSNSYLNILYFKYYDFIISFYAICLKMHHDTIVSII